MTSNEQRTTRVGRRSGRWIFSRATRREITLVACAGTVRRHFQGSFGVVPLSRPREGGTASAFKPTRSRHRLEKPAHIRTVTSTSCPINTPSTNSSLAS